MTSVTWGKLATVKKAVGAFVGGLGGVWAVVLAADWSTKTGAIASIVPIVSAVVTYFTPKNEPA